MAQLDDKTATNIREIVATLISKGRFFASADSTRFNSTKFAGEDRILVRDSCVWQAKKPRKCGESGEVARAYDAAARRLHGEFARVNFEDESGAFK